MHLYLYIYSFIFLLFTNQSRCRNGIYRVYENNYCDNFVLPRHEQRKKGRISKVGTATVSFITKSESDSRLSSGNTFRAVRFGAFIVGHRNTRVHTCTRTIISDLTISAAVVVVVRAKMPRPPYQPRGQRRHVISTRARWSGRWRLDRRCQTAETHAQGLGHGQVGRTDRRHRHRRAIYKYKNASATVTLDHIESYRSV